MVLYNVGDDVKGTESKVTTLTERIDYTGVAGSRLTPMGVGDANPLEIVQARYAIAIARAAGADRFSSDAYVTANQKLAAAEAALAGDKSAERKTTPGLAREAVIAGEDARRAAVLASTENASGRTATGSYRLPRPTRRTRRRALRPRQRQPRRAKRRRQRRPQPVKTRRQRPPQRRLRAKLHRNRPPAWNASEPKPRHATSCAVA